MLREALLHSSSTSLNVISSTLSQLRTTSNLGTLHLPFSSISWSSLERCINWSRLHSSICSSSGSGSLAVSLSGGYSIQNKTKTNTKISMIWPMNWWKIWIITTQSSCPFIHKLKWWMALPLAVPVLFKIRHFSSIISSTCFDTLVDLFCSGKMKFCIFSTSEHKSIKFDDKIKTLFFRVIICCTTRFRLEQQTQHFSKQNIFHRDCSNTVGS